MAAVRHYAMLTNLPVSLMIIAPAFPFQVYLRWGQRPFSISVLNVKALVGAFNQKKALVGLFRDYENQWIVCSSS